jgi:hypothetical protein
LALSPWLAPSHSSTSCPSLTQGLDSVVVVVVVAMAMWPFYLPVFESVVYLLAALRYPHGMTFHCAPPQGRTATGPCSIS